MDKTRIVIDVTERGKCNGWVTHAGKTESLMGSYESGVWNLYAGQSDEYRGSHRTLRAAGLRVFADAFNVKPRDVTGEIEICYEYLGRDSKVTPFQEQGRD